MKDKNNFQRWRYLCLASLMLSLVLGVFGPSHNAYAAQINTPKILREALNKDSELAKKFHAGQVLWGRGQWNKSAKAWRVILEKASRRYGEGHIITETSAFYLGDTYREQQLYAESLPLLIRAAVANEKLIGDDATTALRFNNLAISYSKLTQYDKALPIQQRSVAIYEIVRGHAHKDTAVAILSLALIHHHMGRYQEALQLGQKALAIFENVLGPANFWTGVCLSNLSETYRVLTRHMDALPLQQRAVVIFEKTLGPEHFGLATALGNLALTYGAIEQYEQALPLQQRVLGIYEKVLGADHEKTALGLSNLAATYAKLAQHKKALPLFERALAIFEKALGKDHPDTAVALNNLAANHQALAQYARALPLLKRSLLIFEKSLGPDHPKTATILGNLAVAYGELANFEEELPLLIRALKINEKKLGIDHPSTANSLVTIAATYSNLARHEEAIAPTMRAIAIYENALGAGHSSTAEGLSNLSEIYRALSKYDQALALQLRALSIFEKALGANHPTTAASLGRLAEIYRALGMNEDAVPLQKRALAIAESVLGADHPQTAISLNNLALTYHSLGRDEDALLRQQRALEIWEKVYGPEHPVTARILSNLALIFSDSQQYETALPLQLRALAIDQKVLGEEHDSTALSLNNLAEIYRNLGQPDQALALHLRALTVFQKLLGADHPKTAMSLSNLALIYLKDEQLEVGIIFLKAAVNIYQSQREQVLGIGAAELQSYTQSVSSAYQVLASVLTDQGRLAEAQLVLDMLKENEQFEFIRRSGTVDTSRHRIAFSATEQTWLNRYRQIADQLATLGVEDRALQKQAKMGLSNEQKQRRKALEKDLAVARIAFEFFLGELRDSFAKQGPARAVEVVETSQQALRETQALLKSLGDDVVLLQYYVTDDKVGMLLTTSGVQLARNSKVSSNELNRQIREYRRLLRDPKANAQPAALALYQLLIAPVAQDLEQAGAKTIMLSLDGALRYLPFASLHDGKQYLVQRWNLPMYTSVTKDKLREAVTPQWQAAGLGLTRAVGEFVALPAVKAEMSSIVKVGSTGVLPGEVYLDDAFSAVRLKDVSQRKFQLLHVASHFRFSPGTEVNSFLLLGDGQQLTLGDIRTQNYRFDNVDLLTLSACETGLGGGRDAQGKEIEGFGVIAQQQGAKAVLATLWPVADQSTATLMAEMYKRRQEQSLTKIEALRQAQLSLLSQPRYTHPFYWAPFILMGNWK